jgi:hypothetical protein
MGADVPSVRLVRAGSRTEARGNGRWVARSPRPCGAVLPLSSCLPPNIAARKGSALNLTTPLAESIQRFAEVSARLGDVFADREEVLGTEGLDEAAWIKLEHGWAQRLQALDGEALARRFGEIYEAAQRRARTPATEAPDPRFLTTTAQPWRAEAAAVSLDVSVDAPALSCPPDRKAAPIPLRAEPRPPLPDETDATAELSVYRPEPALPFAPSCACNEQRARPIADLPPALLFRSARKGRWHRFDPQTGEPLPAPRWVDDPEAPKKLA